MGISKKIKEVKERTKSVAQTEIYAVKMSAQKQKKLSFDGVNWWKNRKTKSIQKELDLTTGSTGKRWSSSSEKISAIQKEIDQTKVSVQMGIALAIDRGDKMEDLDDKSQNLSNEASIFNKRAKQTRRHFCLQQWKMIALIAVIVVVLVLIIWLIADPPGRN